MNIATSYDYSIYAFCDPFFLAPPTLADLLFLSLVPLAKAVDSGSPRPMSSSFLTAKIRTIQFSDVNASSAMHADEQVSAVHVVMLLTRD